MSSEDSEDDTSVVQASMGTLIRYYRRDGAICFEVPLLGPEGQLSEDLAIQLLRSSLNWLWISQARPPSPARASEVIERGLTTLTDSSVNTLVADLSERDLDGCGRFVGLFGFRSLATRADSSSLREELKAFAAERGGCIELVVVQPGDAPNDYVYTRREPSREASALLAEWGLRATTRFQDKPYSRLWSLTLENLYKSLDTTST